MFEYFTAGISLTNPLYAAVLLLAPIFLNNNLKFRRYIFCVLNACVITIAAPSIFHAILLLSWSLTPYFAVLLCTHVLKIRWYKPLLITTMVVVFAYLQHYNWIFSTLHISYITVWKVVGISYILFRQLDFIIQYEYNQDQNIRISFIDYFNYQLSFYTLLCGPIVRYQDFVSDFYSVRIIHDFDSILNKVSRILSGFIKIYLISSLLDYLVHASYEHLTTAVLSARVIAWCIVIFGNIWYIYFNFSGFMDVVIPAASLAGFHLPENFNKPYFARDISDFWNRWHITLSSWIKDYIYTPTYKYLLTINKPLSSYFTYFLTFLIIGIWHGPTLNYLVYGILLGVVAMLSQFYTATLRKRLGRRGSIEFRARKCVHILEVLCTLVISSACIIFVGLDIIGRFF
ncbi:MAG: hypothetical protein LBI63_02480 [Candidatus Ancillula sp.]|nr:hypothetical protein [Candidatus Ancillula sp.]